jgi:putative NADH-flavin reductase
MMFLRVAFLVAMTPVWAHAANDKTPSYSFDDFVKEYGKVYATEEERTTRKDIFDANLDRIQSHNAVIMSHIKPGKGHYLRVNEYADRRIPEELPLGLRKKVVVNEDASSSNLFLATQPATKRQVSI